MPGMDGHQLVERLRSRPKTASIAVILLASKADISEKLSTRTRSMTSWRNHFF